VFAESGAEFVGVLGAKLIPLPVLHRSCPVVLPSSEADSTSLVLPSCRYSISQLNSQSAQQSVSSYRARSCDTESCDTEPCDGKGTLLPGHKQWKRREAHFL